MRTRASSVDDAVRAGAVRDHAVRTRTVDDRVALPEPFACPGIARAAPVPSPASADHHGRESPQGAGAAATRPGASPPSTTCGASRSSPDTESGMSDRGGDSAIALPMVHVRQSPRAPPDRSRGGRDAPSVRRPRRRRPAPRSRVSPPGGPSAVLPGVRCRWGPGRGGRGSCRRPLRGLRHERVVAELALGLVDFLRRDGEVLVQPGTFGGRRPSSRRCRWRTVTHVPGRDAVAVKSSAGRLRRARVRTASSWPRGRSSARSSRARRPSRPA